MSGFRTLVDLELKNKGKCSGVVRWDCDFDLGNKSKDPMNPEFFGIRSMNIRVPDQDVNVSFSGPDGSLDIFTISLKDVNINDNLGDCTIGNFKLLPVELIQSEDGSFEIFFS